MKKFFPAIAITLLFGVLLVSQMVINGQKLSASRIEKNKERFSLYENQYKKIVDKTTSGTKINLKAKKGLVIVNFWASWCRPCVSEFKTLNKLKDKYQDKVFILGINNDEEEPRKKVAMIQSKYKLKFESLVDPKGNYASEFNILALPASIVYHNGKVIAFYNKEHDFMSDEFLELIDSHL